MVMVTRLNGEQFYVNPDLIEFIEETPDTVISMTTGRKIVVTESADIIIGSILKYKRLLIQKDGVPERK
ncbi:MAG TPA: flagellar FlbD family protein [Clostridia bacterium]|nr:flagellar FlbD family protein [Clostridia bacterium]